MRFLSGCFTSIFLSSAVMATAADCKQERAIYSDSDGLLELRFEPVGSYSAATTNHFTITFAKSEAVLDGFVMPSEEPVRPSGMVMYNCPEGDATGEEIAACTIWEGVIYSIGPTGKVGLLDAEGSNPAEQILLPAFGSAIRQSVLWEQKTVTVAPWEALAFKGCAE